MANNNFCEVELELPLGKIKGLQNNSIYNANYTSFEGIPYGQPPIGSLRFRPPVPVEPWSHVHDCREYTTIPAQDGKGSEDCLHLNVYSKTLKSEKPLPVIVFIYGGAFRGGDCTRAHYGPDYFMHEQVVLVVPNYRVGALGFLSLKDPELQVPGNNGLKDQLLALQWIQKYIKYFNGDANNITLCGESAGSVSVHLLSISAKSEGLFHKAILMSGTAISDWSLVPPGDAAYRLAISHGYKGENIDRNILEYLMQLSTEQVTNLSMLNNKAILDGTLYEFVPTIEPYKSEHCLIDKSPLETLKTCWSNKIPLLIGGTSFEGIVFNILNSFLNGIKEKLREQPELLLPLEVKNAHTPAELKVMGEVLQELYFGKEARESDLLKQVLDLLSYKMFNHDIYRTILLRLKHATSATYVYYFNFDSVYFNFYRTKFLGDGYRGVSHGDELGYMFLLRNAFKLEETTAEYQTIRRMVSMWSSFATNSDPNCTEIAMTKWEPVTAENVYSVLKIDECVEMLEHPEKKRLEAWNSFYKNVPLI